jgi:2-phosphoglycerate kinase
MMYLIGGAPRCGKTILAEWLSRKKNISYLSTDTVRQMVIACTSHTQLEEKFPYIKLQESSAPYHDVNEYPPEILLNSEITESISVWPSIRALIEGLIEHDRDFVIEGVHLLPSLVHTLGKESYWQKIKILYLIKTDIDHIKDGFYKNTSNHDWVSGALKNEALLGKIAHMVRVKSLYIAQEGSKFGFDVINTEEEFDLKLAHALDYF